MSLQTRSRLKALAATSSQQAIGNDVELLVPVNFVFFDKSQPRNSLPRNIKIPLSLFDDVSQECQSLFASKLLRVFEFKADEHSIGFRRVSSIHESHSRIF